jgi:hypothetical protein
MFVGITRLEVHRAAAAIGRLVPVELAQQRLAAIAFVALHHAQRAPLADLGARLPIRMDGIGRPQPAPGTLYAGAGERKEDA